MLSKPVAALLLVVTLSAAGIGGLYVAMRSFRPDSKEVDKLLQEEVVEPDDTGSPGGGKAGTKADAGRRGGAKGGGGKGSAVESGKREGSSSGGREGVEPEPAELEVLAGQILDIELLSPLSSDTAAVDNRVLTRVLKDVKVGRWVAIPAGASVIGSVTEVNKGGHFSTPAKIVVRLHTLVLSVGGPEFPLVIDPLPQSGPPPSGDSKKKIATGAAVGAALGWLKGGVSGAVAGGAVGGGVGTAGKVMQSPKAAVLPAGSQARVELRAPVIVTRKQ